MKRHTTPGGAAGFTLIELLIVVAIIAILAAIAVPNFLEAQTRAKVSRAMADIKTMVTALETYRIDYNEYISAETNSDLLDHGNAEGTAPPPAYSALRLLSTPVSYLSSIPREAPFGEYKGFNTNNILEKGYQYHGGDLWTKPTSIRPQGERKTAVAAGFLPEPWDQTMYKIQAVGPSKKYSALDNLAHFRRPPYIVPYDATNGTLSLGDIMYGSGPTGGWHSFK